MHYIKHLISPGTLIELASLAVFVFVAAIAAGTFTGKF